MNPSARKVSAPRSESVRQRDRLTFLFGEGTTIVEERYAKSFGARLAVLDVPRGNDVRRCLVTITAHGLVTQQSAMSLVRPEKLVFDYEKVMALAAAAVAQPRRALLLGLGGGAMVRFLGAYLPDCALTVVERDATVVKFARRHFHVDHPVELADAAAFMQARPGRFDAILVDLYGAEGFSAPPLAFWEDCAAALMPKGCLAVNWADGRQKELYRPHADRARALAERTFFLAPRGFKDNVVQLCSNDPALAPALLRERAERLARRQRRKSVFERCMLYDDLP
jgi:spermidine synthase